MIQWLKSSLLFGDERIGNFLEAIERAHERDGGPAQHNEAEIAPPRVWHCNTTSQ
jgi:hypothetical protein